MTEHCDFTAEETPHLSAASLVSTDQARHPTSSSLSADMTMKRRPDIPAVPWGELTAHGELWFVGGLCRGQDGKGRLSVSPPLPVGPGRDRRLPSYVDQLLLTGHDQNQERLQFEHHFISKISRHKPRSWWATDVTSHAA